MLLAVLMLTLIAPPIEAGPRQADRGSNAIEFVGDLDSALEQAKETGKPVFLAFGAAWCPVCRHLQEVTLREPQVEALAGDFVWAKIDTDRKPSLALEWNVEAIPTIFLLDSDGTPRQQIVGEASADELAAILRSFLDSPAKAPQAGAIATSTFPHTTLTQTPQGFRGKSTCFSQVGFGPLNVRSQSPFQSLRLGILPHTPSTLGRGENQVRASVTWANIWSVYSQTFDPAAGVIGPYILDYESLDIDLSYAYGISDTFQIGAGYEQRSMFGGVMDGLIEGFHDLFGLYQDGRDLWPRNQVVIFIDPENGQPPVSLTGADVTGTFARNLLFTIQHTLTCGSAKLPALSWAATARYALGNPAQLEGSNFDVALSAAAARRFGDFYLYLTLGYAWYGSDAVHGIDLETTQSTILAAAEWRFKPRMSLVAQYLRSEGDAKDLGVFSDPSNEIVFGWKWEASVGGVLEVGVLENIVNLDNSPDFGIHAAWTQRF